MLVGLLILCGIMKYIIQAAFIDDTARILRPRPATPLNLHTFLYSQSPYENRSPFRLLYGAELSYLLFSLVCSDSVTAACLVAAGSVLASWLGEPAVSVIAGAPLPVAADEDVGSMPAYSIDRISSFFLRAASSLACRSALISRLAK